MSQARVREGRVQNSKATLAQSKPAKLDGVQRSWTFCSERATYAAGGSSQHSPFVSLGVVWLDRLGTALIQWFWLG